MALFSKKSVLSLTVVLAMLLASCGQTSSGSQGGETSAENTSAPETKAVADIPDTKYDGYAFNLISKADFPTEETGDVVEDAVYERNRMTEERFGITINMMKSSSVAGDVSKSVLAGDNAYDVFILHSNQITPVISAGQAADISKLTYVDLDKPWWNRQIIDAGQILGKSYFLIGDIDYVWRNAVGALCFNKRMYNEYGLEEPYAMVRNGEWTIDVMEEHCKNITRDLNGDAKLDQNDQWGLLSSKNGGYIFVTSTGLKTVDSTKTDMKYKLGTEHDIDVLERIRAYATNMELQLRAEDITGGDIWNTIINIFREGRALYRISIITDIVALRDMEEDFGILPIPKYDANQEGYVSTFIAWSGGVWGVPVTTPDFNRTSAILEYMASISPDTVTKGYYDVTLQGKVSRDNDSSEMLDIIFSSCTVDPVICYEIGGSGSNSLRSILTNIVNSATDTIASSLSGNKSTIEASIADFIDTVKSNAQ